MGYQLRAMPGATVTSPTGNAPTQELGAALHQTPSLQGALTLSARAPDRLNLVIFPAKITSSAQGLIQFIDPMTGKSHRIP